MKKLNRYHAMHTTTLFVFVSVFLSVVHCFQLFFISNLLLMLYIVSMLSMPPQATRFPLGEKAEVITHADFRGITCRDIRNLTHLIRNLTHLHKNTSEKHLYLVTGPAIPNNQFAVQRSAHLTKSHFYFLETVRSRFKVVIC